MSLRIVVAQSHPILLEGLKTMLPAAEALQVVPAATLQETLEAVERFSPQLILLGSWFPDGDALLGLQRIRTQFPQVPVIVHTPFDQPSWLARAVALGAVGCLSNELSREELVAAVTAAARGESLWRREQLRRVTSGLTQGLIDNEPDVHLTARESDVLVELCKGSTNRQIAELLGISYETVKEHVQHLLHKVGVEDRTQAAVWAVRRGLV